MPFCLTPWGPNGNQADGTDTLLLPAHSVINLGTESHRRKYFDDIAAFRLPGCFAMTELKHGAWRVWG